MRRHLLPLVFALAAPGLAGCRINQYPSDQVTRAQSPEYVDFRDNNLLPPAAKPDAASPPGRSVKHPPQYFPPDPVFPLQREPLLVPKAVAPPTPEQVRAVPADLVKFLQTGDFDPNVARAGGTLLPPTTPTNPLDGTVWVRDTKGCRVVVKFTKDGLVADLTTADGFALSVAGDYAVGKDGIVFGVVTRAESPEADGFELGAKLLAADGAPYCFRYRVDAGTLTVRDLRCSAVEATYAVLGAYKKTTPAEPPKASGGR